MSNFWQLPGFGLTEDQINKINELWKKESLKYLKISSSCLEVRYQYLESSFLETYETAKQEKKSLTAFNFLIEELNQ